jgi:hypothetical protein
MIFELLLEHFDRSLNPTAHPHRLYRTLRDGSFGARCPRHFVPVKGACAQTAPERAPHVDRPSKIISKGGDRNTFGCPYRANWHFFSPRPEGLGYSVRPLRGQSKMSNSSGSRRRLPSSGHEIRENRTRPRWLSPAINSAPRSSALL